MKIKPPPPVPNPYPSRLRLLRKRTRIILAGCVVAAFFLATIVSPTFKDQVNRHTLDVVSFVTDILITPFEKISDAYNNAQSLAELHRENKMLRDENLSLKQAMLLTNQLSFENKALKKLLNVPYVKEGGRMTAPVLSIPESGLHQTLMIGSGAREGVTPGQAVVDAYGIVGRIDTRGDRVSRVRLLTDYESRIPVYLPRTNQRAILTGKGKDSAVLVYLEKLKDVQEGDLVLTSGLGGVFPQGLPVGSIAKTQGSNITVEPFAKLNETTFVLILKGEPLSSESLEDVNGAP